MAESDHNDARDICEQVADFLDSLEGPLPGDVMYICLNCGNNGEYGELYCGICGTPFCLRRS